MANSHNGTHNAPFGRLLTAMVTPFDDAGEVDYKQAQRPRARAHRRRQRRPRDHRHDRRGADADARREAEPLRRRQSRRWASDASVLAGTSTYNTAREHRAVARGRGHRRRWPAADRPYYNKPTQEGMYRHFEAIASAVDIPCILYNIPGRTGVNMLPETIVRAAHGISPTSSASRKPAVAATRSRALSQTPAPASTSGAATTA